MLPINKKIVTDEAMRPVAVLIDYQDWQRIEEILQTYQPANIDLNRFAGTINLTQDPLEYQQQIRDEWSWAALILLDTNIVLYLLGGRLANPLPVGQYFASIITEIELLSYPSLSSEEERQIISFLDCITVIGIDNNIKNLAIALRKQYRLRLPDAIIAATAQSLDAILFTNDIRLTNLTEINTQSVELV
jgi:predicted nucleic acid-binding protein